MKTQQTQEVANLFAQAYFDDVFFHWCVPDEEARLKVVAEYYKVYLAAQRAVILVAENEFNQILGACVWLPHDVDNGIYPEITKAVGQFAPQFDLVADKSHDNEPKNQAFYQLVGFGVNEKAQGLGIGKSLLKEALNQFDQQNIPTYLEASTVFDEKSIYVKFGYEKYSDWMHFSDRAILYPLYRKAQVNMHD